MLVLNEDANTYNKCIFSRDLFGRNMQLKVLKSSKNIHTNGTGLDKADPGVFYAKNLNKNYKSYNIHKLEKIEFPSILQLVRDK